jgi:hypothetical protein
MGPGIRTLLPPGGFHNLVGYPVAALDAGLEAVRAAARSVPRERLATEPLPGVPSPSAALRAIGDREGEWIHGIVGRVATPPAPGAEATVDELLAWLDAVRTVTLMVLRPLQDRDLERLVVVPGIDAPTTLRRLLADLQDHQAFRRGQVALGSR